MASLTDNPVNMPLGVFLPALNIFHFALRSYSRIFRYTEENSTFVQNENVRWWPIYHGEQDCVGKIQLFLGSTTSSDEDCHIKVWSFSKNSQIIYVLFCEIMPSLLFCIFSVIECSCCWDTSIRFVTRSCHTCPKISCTKLKTKWVLEMVAEWIRRILWSFRFIYQVKVIINNKFGYTVLYLFSSKSTNSNILHHTLQISLTCNECGNSY